MSKEVKEYKPVEIPYTWEDENGKVWTLTF